MGNIKHRDVFASVGINHVVDEVLKGTEWGQTLGITRSESSERVLDVLLTPNIPE